MSELREEINRLAEEWQQCQKVLLALGGETRQQSLGEGHEPYARLRPCHNEPCYDHGKLYHMTEEPNMTIQEATKARHSVRQYDNRPLEDAVLSALRAEVDACNQESGLHIQLVTNEPKAFDGFMAHYGKFSGVSNYFALIGKKSADLDEKCGYYGERLVLLAQQLGLNTCWVALTYKKIKTAFQIAPGEKLCVIIALGYGTNQGVPHTSKPISQVTNVTGTAPDWFQKGMEAALLAPTAMNQQKFRFTLNGNTVSVKAGTGFYTKVDLGIVKYHFELGAGTDHFRYG